jgi:hypothetical protein
MPLRAALLLCLVLALPARGQREPHIAYLYPAGGQAGTTFELVVGGQFVAGPTNVWVSGGGVTAEIVDYSRPPNARELAELREQVKGLQDRKAAFERASKSRTRPRAGGAIATAATNTWTSADEKILAALRKKVASATRRSNPEISEPVTLQVTIAAEAAPGPRELRLRSGLGLSNPLAFHVSQIPEVCEEHGAPDSRARYGRSSRYEAASSAVENETIVAIPAILNGQIMPGGVDRYRFRAAKGQRLVVAVQARELIPYLANAVPGWFQATVALYDSAGVELAYQDDFRHNPDPAFFYEIEKDGEYVVAVWDAIYRGREDFVYRLTIAETPFVTALFPLGGRGGDTVEVQFSGWNLAASACPVQLPQNGQRSVMVSMTNGALVSNGLPMGIDGLPECGETEPNNQLSSGQDVTLPIVVNGRIGKPGDADIYRFEGAAGSEIVAEIVARRLHSPLDSHLRLMDAAGAEIASNDDHEDKGAGLTSHHADSYVRATLPRDGIYHLQVSDTQRKGGRACAYRLRMGPPQPDFELRVVPSSINVRPGATVPVTIYALRKDGFAGEIRLALKDAPNDLRLCGGWIPAGQDKIRATLTAPARPVAEPFSIVLQGEADAGESRVTRVAVPAEDMMQAFAYRHLVPAQEWVVCVFGERGLRSPAPEAGEGPLVLPLGEPAEVRLKFPRKAASMNFEFRLSDPPEGIELAAVTNEQKEAALQFRADLAKAKPGLSGNLIVMAIPPAPVVEGTNGPARSFRPPPLVLPAIPFVVGSAGK